MATNTTHPDFHSSPYDPKWWLDPPFESTDNFSHQSPISTDDFSQEDDISYIDDFFPDQSLLTFQDDDFSDDCTPESQDKFCDFSKFPTYQNNTCEFSLQNDSANDANDFSPNWYVADLLDQLRYLKKLPSQSMKNYISEAKSLAYALNRAGAPIDDNELIECIIEGLDDSFNCFRMMHPSLSLDSLSHILLSQKIDPIRPSSEHHPTLSDPIRASSDTIRQQSNEPLSAPAQSLQSLPTKPKVSDNQNWCCHSPHLLVSRTRTIGGKIVPVSSMPSARLATAGSLVHSLLYGSSSSPHLARSIFLSDNFKSQYGQSQSATMDSLDLLSAATSIPASTVAMVQQPPPMTQMYPQVHYANLMSYLQFLSHVYVPPVDVPIHSNNPACPHPSNGNGYLVMPGGSYHLTATGYTINATGVGRATGLENSSRLKYKDGNQYVPNPQAETSNIWMNPRDLPSLQSASYYMTGQMPHTASHTDHISFKSMTQSSHMFGRSLRFASYFWIDVILMHAKLLFNLSWKLCVFSILQGVIISLVLQSHGYFPTFKLKLRLPPFRLRGRIREIT